MSSEEVVFEAKDSNPTEEIDDTKTPTNKFLMATSPTIQPEQTAILEQN